MSPAAAAVKVVVVGGTAPVTVVGTVQPVFAVGDVMKGSAASTPAGTSGAAAAPNQAV